MAPRRSGTALSSRSDTPAGHVRVRRAAFPAKPPKMGLPRAPLAGGMRVAVPGIPSVCMRPEGVAQPRFSQR